MIKRLGLNTLKALAVLLIGVICVEQFLFFNSSNDFQPQVFRAKAQDYDVEIVRDEWGVPTVIGREQDDVAFGLGYAQAEDRLEDIERGVILYRGQSAKFLDRSQAEADWLIAWLGVWPQLAAGNAQDQLSDETLSYLQAYVDGVNAFAGTDVKRATPALYPLTVNDLLAGFYLQHVMFYGFDEQLRAALDVNSPLLIDATDVPRGSTAIAVSGSRTDDQSTLLLWNSHQPLRGEVAWYEAHLYTDDGWQFHGGFFPGSPVPFIGANNRLGWGVTVNKPDLITTSIVEGAPVRECIIDVRIYRALSWGVNEPCYGTPEAPVFKVDDRFIEIDYAGKGRFDHIEQWLEMSRSETLNRWQSAFDRSAIPSFNFVVADSSGNIAYRSNATFPARSAWASRSTPVLVNPESGYLASANQTPFAVSSLADEVTEANHGFETHLTNRSLVIHEFFENNSEVTLELFKRLKYDVSLSSQSPQMVWINQLKHSVTLPPRLFEARDLLVNWDGQLTAESSGSALAACMIDHLDNADPSTFRADPVVRLAECNDLLLEHFNRIDLSSTAITRMVDGPNFWSVDGGPDVMRAFYPDRSDFDSYGLRRVTAGDGLHGFVVWKDGELQSIEMISPYGQSIARLTPHRIDQVSMFIDQQLRAIPLTKESAIEGAQRRYRPSLQY